MSDNISQPPKVFISYSWDSDKHKDDVLNLADRLREDGIDCNIDQYEVSPPEGWLHWMRDRIDESDFVLVVCTEQYKRRFQGKEEFGKGKGVTWEGAIINQFIYDQVKNTKFIPVIFSPQQADYIPTELRRFTYYLLDTGNLNLDSNEGYEALYRHLTNQPLHKKPKLGKRRSMPPRQRQQDDYRKDREYEFKEIQQRTELYNDARRRHKKRQWKAVVAIFQQMQELNLPYVDPEGLYRSAYSQLVREREQREQVQRERERKNRELENLYNQGVSCFQAQDWYEAQRKFKEILRLEPRYRDTEAWLVRVKEKLELTKWRSIGLIIIGWVITGLVQMDYREYGEYGVIGGFVSGAVIWWVSQRTKQSEPSQQVLQFLGFCLMGVVAGVILGLTIYKLDSSKQAHGWITAFIGAAISVGVLLWQIRRQVFRV